MGDGLRGISLGSSGDPIIHMWINLRLIGQQNHFPLIMSSSKSTPAKERESSRRSSKELEDRMDTLGSEGKRRGLAPLSYAPLR